MKIYLACINSMTSQIKNDKPLYALESYYNGEKICKKVLNIVGKDNFLLDSGAFTFMNNFKGKINWDEYVENYASFINKYDVKYFFELDIDILVGIKEVERLRNKLEKLTNKQCIPVWHKSRGIEYWKKMVQDYNYIAIGGLAIKHIKNQEYPLIKKMVKYANIKKVKVHGLGFTKTKELKDYGFFSVDSSSWLAYATRGHTLSYFNGHTIKTKKIDANGKKTNTKKITEFNFREWCKYQKYMDIR